MKFSNHCLQQHSEARLRAIEQADALRQRQVDHDLVDFECPVSCGTPIVVTAETVRGVPGFRIHGCCYTVEEMVMNVLAIAEAKRRGWNVK